MNHERIVGSAVPRKEAARRLPEMLGTSTTWSSPDMLYGATVRSQIPRGRIKKIVFTPGSRGTSL